MSTSRRAFDQSRNPEYVLKFGQPHSPRELGCMLRLRGFLET